LKASDRPLNMGMIIMKTIISMIRGMIEVRRVEMSSWAGMTPGAVVSCCPVVSCPGETMNC